MGREPAKRKRLRIGRRLDPNEIDEIIERSITSYIGVELKKHS